MAEETTVDEAMECYSRDPRNYRRVLQDGGETPVTPVAPQVTKQTIVEKLARAVKNNRK